MTISRDMQYMGINIILSSNIRKKRISNLAGSKFCMYLILWFCGFETLCRFKISQKSLKIVNVTIYVIKY